jgi:hypothetical protein
VRLAARLAGLAAAGAAVWLVFEVVVEPWYLNWGATAEERAMALPGDAIIPEAIEQQTRAITIAAPAERVWPWIAQLGQDRGGFYSYDLLENLVGCEMPTEDFLRPEKQRWALGDKLWMLPESKGGGAGFATLRAYEPGRALGFAARRFGTPLSAPEDGSWSFALVPLDGERTRLLVRGRGAPGVSLLGAAFDRAVFEPMHFAMERRMLLGIADLAEGRSRGRVANHLQVGLWVITALELVVALVLVFRRAGWARPLAGALAAAALFQLLTLRQPPVAVGAVLVLALGLFLFRPERA